MAGTFSRRVPAAGLDDCVRRPCGDAARAAVCSRRPRRVGRRAAKPTWCCRTCRSVDFSGINGRTLLMGGLRHLRAWPAVRPDRVHPAQEPAGARVDARGVRAHLRNLQDVSDHAGQVHPAARALHRRDHDLLLRRAARLRSHQGHRHPHLQPDRHRRQLRRGLVRHPREHVRQLAGRVRQPAGQAVSDLRHSAQVRHEHRDAAHQRRAVPDALHPAVHSRATTPAPVSSGSPSANRSAPRRCVSPAASSRRLPISAPT